MEGDSEVSIAVRAVALLSIYVAWALFLVALVYRAIGKARLTPAEREAIRRQRGRRGPIEAVVSFLTLGIAVAGALVYGVRAIPIVSLPMFLAVFVSEALDLWQMPGSKDKLSPRARRTVWIPAGLRLLGIVFWTIAFVAWPWDSARSGSPDG